MNQDLLNKYLNDQCSEDELTEIIHWIKTDAITDYGKELGRKIWIDFQEEKEFGEEERLRLILQKIHQKIIAANLGKKRRGNLTYSWLIKAAAVILLPILGFLFYLTFQAGALSSGKLANSEVNSLQVITPTGSRTIVQLPDGSEVHLNHMSKLTYPQQFTGKSREVVLQGEGYFKIVPNPKVPFIVKTAGIRIKALGTEFNVLAYPGEEVIATTLVSGKIVVEKMLSNGNMNPIASMLPGQHLTYFNGKENTKLSNGKIEKYIAWKDGKLMFDNEPITNVAEELSRIFNVNIIVADNIRDLTYTVTFVDEPLYQILDLMKIATPVKYRILPRKKLPDGTFSKQKIIIEKK